MKLSWEATVGDKRTNRDKCCISRRMKKRVELVDNAILTFLLTSMPSVCNNKDTNSAFPLAAAASRGDYRGDEEDIQTCHSHSHQQWQELWQEFMVEQVKRGRGRGIWRHSPLSLHLSPQPVITCSLSQYRHSMMLSREAPVGGKNGQIFHAHSDSD